MPMSLAATMLKQVHDDRLVDPGRPLIVLLSGGRDSTCLLDLMVAVSGAENVHALHVNYGLRDTADRDQRRCEQLCRELAVTLVVSQPSVPPAGNVQAWARQQRFTFATELAGRLGGAQIATGYTATDQLETVLYRIISSPSRRAVLGARPRHGEIIRPLLGFTREQTGGYCSERGLHWVDDETNATGKYVRNRIRNELVPLLADLHPGAADNVLALAATLRDEQRVLDELVDHELGITSPAMGEAGAQPLQIELARLRAMPPGLARLVLQRMADAVNGEPSPGITRRLADVLALPDAGTAHLDLPQRVRATVSGGRLRLTETDSKPRDAK
jgi:tRNA(Ile)-lysidine synthase